MFLRNSTILFVIRKSVLQIPLQLTLNIEFYLDFLRLVIVALLLLEFFFRFFVTTGFVKKFLNIKLLSPPFLKDL